MKTPVGRDRPRPVQYWVRLAVLLTVGVLLPVVVHLAYGPAGRVLLPIHLPTLLAGLLLGPLAGVIVGLISPGLNFLLVGMPPLSPPLLPAVTLELVAYGLIGGLLAGRHGGWLQTGGQTPLPRIWGWLVMTQILGRVALGFALAVIAPLVGWPLRPYPYVMGALVTGWPGVLLQWLLLPPIVRALLHIAR